MPILHPSTIPASATLIAALLAPAAFAQQAVITFDDGVEGWSSPPMSMVVMEGGNPGAHLVTMTNNFGLDYRNSSHPDFIGDYSTAVRVVFGLDLKVDQPSGGSGTLDVRPVIVMFRNAALEDAGGVPVTVWYRLTTMDSVMPWARHEVAFDPRSVALPEGWKGTGANDPGTSEPILPAGVTFADVLEGVTEVRLTTYEPGWFYIPADFNIGLDNIAIDRQGDAIFNEGFDPP